MKIIENISPNYSARNSQENIKFIVLHYTGMKSFDEAMHKMCDEKAEVSAHYCVNEDGKIYRLVEDKNKAWHAGKSFWAGYEGLNEYSIGIEIINPGHEFGYREFPQEQISSVMDLVHQLKYDHRINKENIVAHSDIAPLRKEDPGELFPWKFLADNQIGIYHDIDISSGEYVKGDKFQLGDKSKKIFMAQVRLKEIGYKIEISTEFTEEFKKVLTAFYRRFFPERIFMQENQRYPDNIILDEKAMNILNYLAKI
jgi:N-acetylmuramoyl-L-alanine amidase